MELTRIKKLPLRYKTLAIATGFSVLILTAAAIFWFSYKNYQQNRKVSENFNSLLLSISQLSIAEKEFHQNETTNIMFYELGESESISKFNKHFEEAQNLLTIINKNEHLSANLKKDLNELNNSLINYKTAFSKITDAYLIRGNKDQGKLGTLNTTSELIFNKIAAELNEPYISELFAQLQILEKKYLVEKNPNYQSEMIIIIENLESFIESQKSKLSQTINDAQIHINEPLTDSIDNQTITQTNYNAVLSQSINDAQIHINEPLTDSIDNQTITQTNFNTVFITIEGLINLIENYKSLVEEIVAIDQKIGITKDAGLVGILNENYAAIELHKTNIKNEINELNTELEKQIRITAIATIFILLAIIALLIRTMTSFIQNSLENIRKKVKTLSTGNFPEKENFLAEDEFGIINSEINLLTTNLKNARNFVQEVGKGNIEHDFSEFIQQGDFGKALHDMGTELKRIAEERISQEKQNQHRHWRSTGLAKINDILRLDTTNIEDLTYEVIRELVNYLGAIQGTFFIKVENPQEEAHLQLVSSYAYNRRKLQKVRIEIGEGITGICAKEKRTIYIDNLPAEHFEIVSGVGESKPRYLLVIPLKLNDEIFGIIELASYKEFSKQEIDFTEDVGQTVASSISRTQINIQTARMFEESKQQAQELAAKEEEMRQNMEELQATQEEAAAKEAIATGFVESVNRAVLRIDFSSDGNLIYSNEKMFQLTGFLKEELNNAHFSRLIFENDIEFFSNNWIKLSSTFIPFTHEIRLLTKTGYHWLIVTLSPILNKDEMIEKILMLGFDINQSKNFSLDFEKEINAINRSILKIEYSEDGTILKANDLFLSTLRYTSNELTDKDIFSLIRQEDLQKFEHSWKKIVIGLPQEGQICLITKNGKEKWFQGAHIAIKDIDGKIYKITYIGYDITKQKQIETTANNQFEVLTKLEENLKTRDSEVKELNKIIALNKNQSEAYIEALQKTTCIAEYQINGTIISANPLFCELFGYVESDIINRHHRMFIQLSKRKSTEYLNFWERLKKNEVISGSFKRMAKDGTEIMVKGIYYPVIDDNKKPYKVIELIRDVTENIISNNRLSAHYNAIKETFGLAEFNFDGSLRQTNKRFNEIFGYAEETKLPQHHRLFMSEDLRYSDEYRELWLNLGTGKTQHIKHTGIRYSGEEFEFNALMYSVNDISGMPSKILMVVF